MDWRSKSGDAWFSPANIEGEPGIWKLEETKSPVKIVSGSPDLWVDAAAGKLFVRYLGHLLRVPLAK